MHATLVLCQCANMYGTTYVAEKRQTTKVYTCAPLSAELDMVSEPCSQGIRHMHGQGGNPTFSSTTAVAASSTAPSSAGLSSLH